MLIQEEVLSKELLEDCLKDLENLVKERVWGNSEFLWEDDLQKGFPGIVTNTSVSSDVSEKLWSELSSYLLEYDTKKELVEFQYYMWNRGSAIPFHNDDSYHLGGTIYLNTDWLSEWGGLFIWNERYNKLWKALCPTQNMMVLNTHNEPHMVTEVSSHAPQVRVTIQIFCWPEDVK